MNEIKIDGLSFSYGSREVLKNISFNVQPGEFVSVLGCNGVGKSTLFRCMLGLLRGYSGVVTIDGRDVRSMSAKEIAGYAAYIPQSSSPAFNYSVEDMVLFGTTSGIGAFSAPGRKEQERADSALERMGIEDLRLRCYHHLSGGERQLVIIARAIAQNAGILLLDEPTASLDFGNQMRVLRQIRSLADEGYTVIQTTHSPEHSYLFSDRILVLKDGEILSCGTPSEVIVPEIMSSIYGLDVKVESLYDDRMRVCTGTF